MDTQQDLIKTFKKHGTSVYRYIYFRLGYSKELAEDLSQEVFEKAWQKRDTYNPDKASLKNWLFVIARNTVTDYYRKKKLDTVPIESTSEHIDKTAKPENKALTAEVMSNLRKLSETDKELLILRYTEGMDINEIAQLTNKSYNATKVAVHRAIKRLKQLCNEKSN